MSIQQIPSRFQRRVYRALRRIPRGKVITYKGLAERIGTRSARAVGNALAKNPFPLIIPCHRVVSSSRGIGGFSLPAGRQELGRNLKKKLLRREGVIFDKRGRIPEKFFV